MKNIKLVAIDMDGTLLNKAGQVSKENREALKRLRAEGKDFIICTGRNYEDAKRPLEIAQLECDLICMNGAITCSYEGEVYISYAFQEEQLENLLNFLEPHEVVIDLMTRAGSFSTTDKEIFKSALEKQILLPTHDSHVGMDSFQFTSKQEFLDLAYPVYKLSAIHETETLLHQIKSHLKDEEGISIASSAQTNIEITRGEAKKGLALMTYAKQKGIKEEEIMAIGDSGNDVSMLSLELGATVAMANAMVEAKKVAQYLTTSNEESGVAAALKQFVLG